MAHPTTTPLRAARSADADDSFLSSFRSSPAALSILWVALVALGVAGRLAQPSWNVTPMAAVALAAGGVFANPLVAATVPLTALLVSNLGLDAYDSLPMAAVVFAATAWPVLLGGLLRRATAGSRFAGMLSILGGALASSLVFFLTTNFAFWWFTSEYPHTAEGLFACFLAALPFYRWMPVGDVAWSLAAFAGLAAAARIVHAAAARGLQTVAATAESAPVKRVSDVA